MVYFTKDFSTVFFFPIQHSVFVYPCLHKQLWSLHFNCHEMFHFMNVSQPIHFPLSASEIFCFVDPLFAITSTAVVNIHVPPSLQAHGRIAPGYITRSRIAGLQIIPILKLISFCKIASKGVVPVLLTTSHVCAPLFSHIPGFIMLFFASLIC